MKDKTMLEVIDRLQSALERAVRAEERARQAEAEIEVLKKRLIGSENIIDELKTNIEGYKKTLEETKSSMSYWADKALKLEKEAQKNDISDKPAD